MSELVFDQGINLMTSTSGFPVIDRAALDFEKYPFWGFEIKGKSAMRLPGAHAQLGCCYSQANVPMVKFAFIGGLNDALKRSCAALAGTA